MMNALNIGVILASVRDGRRGEVFARWIVEKLAERPDVHVQSLDLRDWPFGGYAFRDGPTVAEKSYANHSLPGRWRDAIAALDAFVTVTPEYSHGYPGALKNALDHLYTPRNYKPVGFVSYGGFASGARAVEQLRQIAVELRMIPIRDELNVRLIGLAADDAGRPTDELYAKRAAVMVEELIWWSRVVRDGRASNPR